MASGNAADSSTIALTDKPLPRWKPKTNESLKVNLE